MNDVSSGHSEPRVASPSTAPCDGGSTTSASLPLTTSPTTTPASWAPAPCSAHVVGTTNRAVTNLAVLRLLQICSPAFPIGAFAYSQGLEKAADAGWLNQPEDLCGWLKGTLLHGLARTDLPLLRAAYRQWRSEPTTGAMVTLSQRVLAYRETAELRAEEQHLGRALARLLSHLGVERAEPFREHEDATYLVMFALAATHFEIGEPDMLGGFAFAWAENQVSAASRVMRLGQLAAQRVLSEFIETVPAALDVSANVDDDCIGYSSPAFFLASAWHEEQYSRLFRS